MADGFAGLIAAPVTAMGADGSVHLEFAGLIAAPVTAMGADGSVHLDAVDAQAAALAANGVAGAFVCGTTGEGVSLSAEERMAVAARWRQAAAKGFRVIVHVGHQSTVEARRLAEHAERIGADAVAAAGPCFFKPATLDHFIDYLAEIAAATALPFYYYHIPSMTGVNVKLSELLARGGKRIPTFAGAKFTHEDLMDFALALALDGGRYELLFGRDEFLLAALALGARGAVGTTYGFAAPLYRRIVAAFERGDMPAARADQRRAMEMIRTFRAFGGGPAAAKGIMKLIGLDAGPVRPPLRSLTDAQLAELREQLDGQGFFEYCNRLG